MGMATSCSSDDPAPPGQDLTQKTYSAEELTLSLDGNPVSGQTVTFTPSADGKGTIILAGEQLDLNEILGAIPTKSEMAIGIATPSMIPGSTSVTIPVELTGETDNCTFSGSTESTYCTFSYSGELTADNLSLSINNLKLKNTSLAGTYATPEDIYVTDGWGDKQLSVNKVMRIIWKAENNLEVMPGWGMPIETVIPLAMSMTLLPNGDGEKKQLPALLTEVLKTVTFGEDGYVTAQYADTNIAGWPTTTSPKGLAQYVVNGDGTILLFLNPQSIIAAAMPEEQSTRALDPTILMEGLLSTVLPMISNGIPVRYGNCLALDEDGQVVVDGNGNLTYDDNTSNVSFYLDKEVLLPILKLAAPILTDEDIVNQIVEAAAKDPDMGMMAGMLPGMLAGLPGVIDTTTEIQLGLNLVKK